MYKRFIKSYVEKALNRAPVVLLNGARQVGKSTLALEFVAERGYNYLTFDDEMVYLAAKSDPKGFISGLQKPIIIDEVQRVPEIFLAIKMDVDAHRTPGRYLLTGSANPLLIPRLGDSLAGRMEVVELFPLSQGELAGRQETFIDLVFSDEPLHFQLTPVANSDLYRRIITGGYPPMQDSNEENQEAWMRSYINLILQRDIKELANIEKVTELPNLLKILAHRATNLLNVAEVSRDIKMVTQTVHRYLALLQTIFLIHVYPAWSNNLALRTIKAPKVCLVDSGLLAYLLGIPSAAAMVNSVQIGKLLENFVVNELQKQISWSTTRPGMYHFRATSGEEVDVLLEDRAGNVVGIEIKHSSRVDQKDLKGMHYVQNKVGNKFKKGIVLYGGNEVVPFGNNVFAVPLHALWQ